MAGLENEDQRNMFTSELHNDRPAHIVRCSYGTKRRGQRHFHRNDWINCLHR